jgi:hypothetical protein
MNFPVDYDATSLRMVGSSKMDFAASAAGCLFRMNLKCPLSRLLFSGPSYVKVIRLPALSTRNYFAAEGFPMELEFGSQG